MKAETRSLASIYRTKAKLIFMAQAKTEAGFYLAIEPVRCLPLETNYQVIGESLRSVLAGYRVGLPTPSRDEYKNLMSPVLAAAGFKSWSQISKQAMHCMVEVIDSTLAIEVSHFGGLTGDKAGYQPHDPVRRISIPISSTNQEVGLAVITALDLCTR